MNEAHQRYCNGAVMDDDVVDRNLEIYKQEIALAPTILRRNRYDTVTGEWLGPDPEPVRRSRCLTQRLRL